MNALKQGYSTPRAVSLQLRVFFSCESEVLVWTKVHRTNVDTVLRQQTEQFCVTTRDCEVNSEVSVPYGDDAKEAKRASIPAQLTIPCADARGGPGGGSLIDH